MANKSVHTFQFKKEIQELVESVIYLPEGKTHVLFDGMYKYNKLN